MGALQSRLAQLGRLAAPGPAILMYHRVAEPAADPWELAVSRARFDDQMAVLVKRRRPLTMDVFVRRLRAGDLPSDAIAVTFDDGYLDNLISAKPALEKHGVPATVFLATGLLGRPAGYWWDELERMVLSHGAPLDEVVAIGGEPFALRLPGGPRAANIDRGWRAMEPKDDHQTLYLALWRRLLPLGHAGREAGLESLRKVFGATPAPAVDQPMTREQIRTLASGDLVSVGAHTLHHPSLPDLPREDQAREIQDSRSACESLTGKPATGFAYPYGARDAGVIETVRGAGFDWACTTIWASVRRTGYDAFALPRVPALDADGDRLLWRLRGA